MNNQHWKLSLLPSLLQLLKSGGTPSTSRNDYYGGEIPFVTIEDMTSCTKFLSATAKSLSPEGLKNSNAWLVPKNAILYSIYATLGIPRINEIPVATNQAILALIPKKNHIDEGFLYYWLEKARNTLINANSSQTTQKNLSLTIVKTFRVYHPKALPEQAKIAEVLSTVDQAIEQTESLIAKQQRIKTGLMQDLLTRGIDEHGNLRSEETHEFKDSPLGRIPVEWEVKKLNEIVEDNITYGIVQAGPHVDGGVPYIRTGDMKGDQIKLETLLRTSAIIAKSFKRSEVSEGNIVFALRATVGKVLPITSNLAGCNLTRGTAKIAPISSINTTFLLWAMRSTQVQNAIRLDQKGTTFMEITLGALRRIQLALPKNKAEQSLIADSLEKQHSFQSNLSRHLNKLMQLKTALMQDLLTGKVRVTPLLDNTEPNS